MFTPLLQFYQVKINKLLIRFKFDIKIKCKVFKVNVKQKKNTVLK